MLILKYHKQHCISLLLCFLSLTGMYSHAQIFSGYKGSNNVNPLHDTFKKKNTGALSLMPINNWEEINIANLDTNTFKIYYYRTCKFYKIAHYQILNLSRGLNEITKRNATNKSNKQLLSVHGSIHYDFVYRSYVDTPFMQHDFQQHTTQSSLQIMVREKYPINLNLSHRQSNSPYFRVLFDVNLQFDRNTFLRNAKQRSLERLSMNSMHAVALDHLETELKKIVDQYNDLSYSINKPDVHQRIVKEREDRYYQQSKSIIDSNKLSTVPNVNLSGIFSKARYKLNNDYQLNDDAKVSKDSISFIAYIKQKEHELDSLRNRISVLQSKSDSIKNLLNTEMYTIKQKIYKANNFNDLRRIEAESGIEREKNEFVEEVLSNVKSIGLGRSLVNYSELTISNVSLTGFNIEYNPRTYMAFAAGKVDYGFRNFFGKNTRKLGQNIIIGRFGIGDKDHKALIFSAFTGKKHNYSSLLADTATNNINVVGYSLEAIFKKDQNTSLSAEIAKTTKPVTGRVVNNNELKSLADFSDYSNVGVSLKGQTYISVTDTRVNGFYRQTGKNFQSFNLFSYNNDQTAWQMKVDQSLLKNKIGITGSVRRNDFTNPFSNKTFKTSTVFKSIQINARFPKWPVISAGYYPGSQLYMVDEEKIMENAYYLLNGSVIYNYSLGNVQIVSSAIYNRYSSKGTDSGFIAYKGVNYMLSNNFVIHQLQLQGSYTYTDQELLKYHTWEANADYRFSQLFRCGIGTKYNKVSGGKTYVGNRAFLGFDIKVLGSLQLQYEKSFLPTTQRTLFPVEVGRLSWLKYF